MRIPATLEHLAALTDDVGVIQHAVEDIPNRSTGYCVDDVARALIVATAASAYPQLEVEALRLGRIYLAYLLDAQRTDGKLRNFMGYDRRWLEDVGSEDSFGRGLWGLGYTVAHARKATWRNVSSRILLKALPHVEALTHTRSASYAAIGLALAYPTLVEAQPALRQTLCAIAERLRAEYQAAHADTWTWFEACMTYDNARLCEALLRIGTLLQREEYVDLALDTLEFYKSVVIENGVFTPIGNDGWWHRDGKRARFDQQPLEAAGLVDGALCAFDVTGDERYRRLAEVGYDWFFGRNVINAPLVIDAGCRDGFSATSVNRNMGAESTLAYLASAFALGPYLQGRSVTNISGHSAR